jgi:hypothetical protein
VITKTLFKISKDEENNGIALAKRRTMLSI